MASSQICPHGHCRPLWRSKMTTASIQMVRCAGTPQPENSAYKVARKSPPKAPAPPAGQARHSRGVKRADHLQRPAISRDAAQANMVI